MISARVLHVLVKLLLLAFFGTPCEASLFVKLTFYFFIKKIGFEPSILGPDPSQTLNLVK